MAKAKMTYQELIKLNSALISMESLAKNVPGEAWADISATKYKIENNYKAITEARDKVIEKYVKKDAGGWKMSKSGLDFEYKSEDAKKKYNDEMKPLLAKIIEVTIEKIEKSKINKATFDGVPNIMAFFHHCVK